MSVCITFFICLAAYQTLRVGTEENRDNMKLIAFGAVTSARTSNGVKLLLSSQIHRADCICLVSS